MSRAARGRLLVGAALVLTQLGLVIYTHAGSQWGAYRYFSWAPNDYSVDYHVSATVNGRTLDAAETAQRYHMPQDGFYEDPPQRLIHVLQRWELSYRHHDRTTLAVAYRLNGHQETHWTWTHG